MNEIISVDEFYDDLANQLSKEIADYSPQIFFDRYKKRNLPLLPDCSSILITIDERFFLITAGHCVHNMDISSIGVMIENDFFTIGGSVKYFEPNDMNFYEPNNLDIAIYELHNDTVTAFKQKYKFLKIDQLGLNRESSEISRYILFGYPEYKTSKHVPTKTIIAVPLIIRTTGVSRKFYVKEKVDYTKILILNADQKNVVSSTTKSLVELPDLNGISGCGIWNVSNVFEKKPQYKLVSILTGENFQKTVLYSAKVDYLKILFQAYFDVKSF